MVKSYDKAYYDEYDIGSKTVSYLESTELRQFHANVVRELISYFHPHTTLDAGCAMGILVSEFAKHGVEAYGIDFSEYAVTHADPLARPNCYCGSLAEPFPTQLPEHFDLVTCMEVVEHMTPEDGRKAIANLCKVTDTIIFCSTPDDFEDKTHINVQDREYWAAWFAENGFYDDLSYRPLFLTSYAVCYRRMENWNLQLQSYERYIRKMDEQLRDFRDSNYKALEQEHEKAVAQWTRTANDLDQVNLNYNQLKNSYERQTEQVLSLTEQLNTFLSKQSENYEESVQKCVQTTGDALTAMSGLNNAAQKLDEAVTKWFFIAEELEKEKQENKRLRTTLEKKKDELCQWKESYRQNQENGIIPENCRKQLEELGLVHQNMDELVKEYRNYVVVYRATLECLNNTAAELEKMRASHSWKMTAPVRWMSQNIKRLIGKTARTLYHGARKARDFFRHSENNAPVVKVLNWPPHLTEAGLDGTARDVPVTCRRLGIYTIYDKDGIVDEYIIYYLEALLKWVQKIIVVSNGPLEEDGRKQLEKMGCTVVIRENKGFDAWGVKAGIESMGFEALTEYDEVVISNNTLFGPVRDFKEMFTEMSGRKVDFWGITSHSGWKDNDPFKTNPYGYIPEHVQSYFYVLRKRILSGEAFRQFWTNLPELPDYNYAVGMYETVMTKYFSDAGYTWSAYLRGEDYYDMTDNPLITMPVESIRDLKCPFVKRRLFFQDYDYITTYTGHQAAGCLMRYLQEETDYPVKMIWQNLLRTCHMSDVSRNLGLSRVFSRDPEYVQTVPSKLKAALFMHIYDHTMAPELLHYASSLPVGVDIYISTVSEEKKQAIADTFRVLENRVEIRVLPNRGRDVSALLTSFQDVVMNYDVACVTHDKKTGYLKPQTVGEGFAYMGYENILASRTFVEQVLEAFEQEPYLGLLYAPDPHHADFASHIGLEWGPNFECTKKLAQELKLDIPMDQDHPPMAPFGSSFWFRTAAMRPLFDKHWTYDDFPEEPFKLLDGSILHAIERIYPYSAQQAGYYSAMLSVSDYAALDIDNLMYCTEEYQRACMDNGVNNIFIWMRDTCKNALTAKPLSKICAPEGKLHKLRDRLTAWSYLE